MKDSILKAYQKWRTDPRDRAPYPLSDNDRRVANIAAMYSENDLRLATVMRAAYRRIECKEIPVPKLPSDAA